MNLQRYGAYQPSFSFSPVQSFRSQPAPFFGQQVGGGRPIMGQALPQIMSLLMNMLSSMTQLSQGWSGFGGQQQQQQPQQVQGPQSNPFGYNPSQGFGGYGGQGAFGGYAQGGFGGYQGQGGFPGQGFGRPLVDYASQHFPQSANYGGPDTGYGGGTVQPTSGLPRPSDPQEFASYLQAQLAGGTLEGKTTVAQKDAIPGSRFGRVQDGTQWQASLARNYAYQFAAFASGNDPLSADGVAKGADAFEQMKPEAQLFMQVASVFKGNLLNGPGFYDNPGLKTLLESKGLNDLAGQPQVGKTDVQSIGAIASAIDSGALTLNEVISSGTISDLDRYQQVISYVSNGGFASDLNAYDNAPI